MKFLFVILALCSGISTVFAQTPDGATSEEQPDTLKLKEVVVSVSRPILKIEGDGMVTSIQGTILQNLGTAKDVLGYIPGIQNNNGSIEVIGKGAPTVYINGRVMRSNQELDQLRSDKVKEVKLITNPGARYDGSVNSVIRITTVKNLGDGFALDSRSSFRMRDYFGGREDLAMNYRSDGLDVFGNLEYDYNRTKGTATNVQNTWATVHDCTEMKMSALKRSQVFDGKVGFNYLTLSNHSFGVYYQISHKPVRNRSEYTSTSFHDDVLDNKSNLEDIERTNYTEHLVDAYYSGKWGEWEAEFSFDALWRNNNQQQHINEESSVIGTRTMNVADKSRGRLFAGELNLSKSLWKGTIGLGVSYSNSNRKDIFTGFEDLISNNDNRISEGNIGAYIDLSQNFKWFMLQLGLRYEHVNSNYYEYGVRQPEVSRKYNRVLPSVNLVFPIGKVVLQAGYARKYNRPLYSQLSSTVTYVNQYLYECGNPLLQPSVSDNLSLNLRWKWLMFMGSYRHVNDQIITSASSYDGSSSITLLRKDNSPNSLNNIQLMASIVPGMIKSIYYPILTFGVMAQSYKINYLGSVKNMDRPMPIVQFNNMLSLPSNFLLSTNLKWRGKGESENIMLEQAWQIDLSIQKTFNKHWNIKLSANDIFNTSHKSGFTIYSGIREIQMLKYGTSRNFELTVNYKFNTTKSNYKGKGTNKEEIDRL